MSHFKGTVKWFNNVKGTNGYRSLHEGDPVASDVIDGDKGRQANQVTPLK